MASYLPARVLMNRHPLLETIRRAPGLRHFVNENLIERTPWLFETTACATGRGVVRSLPRSTYHPPIFWWECGDWIQPRGPYKPGRPFRRTRRGGTMPSDPDIAIIAPNAFVEAWDTLVTDDSMGCLARPFLPHLAPP